MKTLINRKMDRQQ